MRKQTHAAPAKVLLIHLWLHSLSTEKSRHNVNPGLLYAPKAAGGIGLISILVAVKAQRMKHALLWLTQREDRYGTSWKQWNFRGSPQTHERVVTPHDPMQSRFHRHQLPGASIWTDLVVWLRPHSTKHEASWTDITCICPSYFQTLWVGGGRGAADNFSVRAITCAHLVNFERRKTVLANIPVGGQPLAARWHWTEIDKEEI